VQPCQRARCCGVWYLARDGGGLSARRYAARRHAKFVCVRVLCRVKAQRLVVNARGVVFTGGWFCAAVRAWRGHAAGCVDFAPSASRITSVSSRPPSARARACNLVSVFGVAGCGTLRGAAAAYPRAVMRRVATRNLCVCAFCVALRHSVLSSMCARRCVGGCVILCGRVRVAGTRGRVRWLCPIHTPHNKRIKPTAFGAGPRVQLCQRVWCCGVRYLARGGGGLSARRYAARRQQDKVVRAFCVALRHSVLSSTRARCRVCRCVVLRGRVRVAGTRGRVRWLCPIRKPHNKRIKPTAFGAGPRVPHCQRAWCCGVRYFARGGGGLSACRYAARRQQRQSVCARSVLR
jgi:hypothetical protein